MNCGASDNFSPVRFERIHLPARKSERVAADAAAGPDVEGPSSWPGKELCDRMPLFAGGKTADSLEQRIIIVTGADQCLLFRLSAQPEHCLFPGDLTGHIDLKRSGLGIRLVAGEIEVDARSCRPFLEANKPLPHGELILPF